MKICSCTIGFRSMDFGLALNHLRDMGIAAVEGTTDHSAHLYPYVTGEKDPEELKRIVSQSGLTLAAIMGQSDFAVNDDLVGGELERVEKQILLAHAAGVSVLRLFAGHIPAPYVTDEVVERVVTNLKRVAPAAESRNVTLAIENHYGITSSPTDMLRIIEGVASERVKVNFDPANFVPCGENPVSAARRLAPFIAHVHLKDCIHTGEGPHNGYEYCEIGAGIVDFTELLSVLKENGYEGYLSIEYESPQDPERGTRASLEALTEILSQI
jgi:sugar phosphate isomerase/epimerase